MMKRPKYYIFCLSIIIGLVGAALFEAKRNEIFLRETVRILFDDPGINYLYFWQSFPKKITLHGDLSAHVLNQTEKVIKEINTIAGRDIYLAPEATGGSEDINIAFSKLGNSSFEKMYADLFRDTYGDEEFRKWSSKGVFVFPPTKIHPCFTNMNFDIRRIDEEGYLASAMVEKIYISIGSLDGRAEDLVAACLREELAHAAFFFPDRILQDGQESIFNANLLNNERTDYSEFDKKMIKMLASDGFRTKLMRYQFIQSAEHYLVSRSIFGNFSRYFMNTDHI